MRVAYTHAQDAAEAYSNVVSLVPWWIVPRRAALHRAAYTVRISGRPFDWPEVWRVECEDIRA